MTQPTSKIQPYTATLEQIAKIELDEDNSSLLPGDYIYWLVHIPKGASLVKPFYSSDNGNLDLVGTSEFLERSQAGLVLDDKNRSVNLDYYPTGTPSIVPFGNELVPDTSKLRSGLVVPKGVYDDKKVYIFV